MAFMLNTGPASARHRLILAHGAGAGIESPFLDSMAELLAERDIAVTRFEFQYMSARREGGRKGPPPKVGVLMDAYRAMIGDVRRAAAPEQTIVIGGKSLGGRVASMIADEALARGEIAGLVCLGYPFHPPAKPAQLRTEHLRELRCPALIIQGERDPFGNREDVAGYALAPGIQIVWMGDGDHDLLPRSRSGFTRNGNLSAAADAVAAFILSISRSS